MQFIVVTIGLANSKITLSSDVSKFTLQILLRFSRAIWQTGTEIESTI